MGWALLRGVSLAYLLSPIQAVAIVKTKYARMQLDYFKITLNAYKSK